MSLLEISSREVCKHIACNSTRRRKEFVRTNFKGDRPLGVIAQRSARNSKMCCFFLNSARVRDEAAAFQHELKEIKIAEGFYYADLFEMFLEISCLDSCKRARMQGPDNRQVNIHRLDKVNDPPKQDRVIGVFLPVNGRNTIRTRHKTE